MIVRISGTGQYELDDEGVAHLHQLDAELTNALHSGQEQEFHRLLTEVIQYVEQHGTPVGHDKVVPSDVIVPPEDITMAEARNFFTDEGLMEPVPV